MAYSPQELGYVTVRLDWPDWQQWRDSLLANGPAGRKQIQRRVNNLHITLLFGLHPNVALEALEPILAQIPPFEVHLTGISVFQRKRDILKFDAEAPALYQWHEALKQLPHTLTHDAYRPHATIAYLRRGYGAAYAQSFAKPITAGLRDMQYTRVLGDSANTTRFYAFGFAPAGPAR
jgi:2'-5' RNA ligase